MKKCSSHGKKGTAISVSKSPQQKSSICRYHVTFKPTVDFLREANGEQVFFEDHMRMESFRNDPEIFEAVQMLHRELERSAPVRGMVLGGMK